MRDITSYIIHHSSEWRFSRFLTFGLKQDALDFVFLCRDSAKHASMMALAAPSVQHRSSKLDSVFGFLGFSS